LAPVKDVLISTGYRLAWKVINRVPESWARWGFDTATSIAWRRQGPGVQMLENNLLRVLGPETTGKELRRTSRAGMRSYGRYWMEVFRLPTITPEQIQRDMVINSDAEEALADAAAGQGVIFGRWPGPKWSAAGSSSPPWPSGSSPSRCSTCSSRSARESAWRCCR
jgi:lauroyl/myristoyl acyltransferase